MSITEKLVGKLGVSSERLRLEGLTAFSSVARVRPSAKAISEAMASTNVRSCLECGKCTSNCPVACIKEVYSPRAVIEGFHLGMEERVLSGRELWMCTGCYLCAQRCPSDVGYPEFVATVRAMADPEIKGELCAHAGIPLAVSRVMASPVLLQRRMDWVPSDAKIAVEGDILYFVGCLPYFDIVFGGLHPNSLAIAQSAVRIFNSLDVEPVVMRNERCCGHDLYWTGDFENFRRVAEINVETIRAAGAKKVVTSCAECYRTLAKDYPRLLGTLGFEVVHLSQYLADLIEKNKVNFDASLEKNVAYYDPCRLGRHMGIYDAPRKVLESIPGVTLVEMENSREDARCCGVSSWLACSKETRELTRDRLREAKATGAELLVTTCPKCQIHFKCVTSQKVKPEDTHIPFLDLAVAAAAGMGLDSGEG